ncbi:MAG TPA: plastocyanin, partial [Mycobacterium sp.]|nr:plastocyanin [Mycobacterium sp.]
MLRKHLVVALAGAVMLAGCSSSPPAAQPSVTFGSGASATPGMPGMSGMPPASGAPTGSASATGSPGAAAGDQVSIDNFAFAPATLTVKVGSTVTW